MLFLVHWATGIGAFFSKCEGVKVQSSGFLPKVGLEKAGPISDTAAAAII